MDVVFEEIKEQPQVKPDAETVNPAPPPREKKESFDDLLNKFNKGMPDANLPSQEEIEKEVAAKVHEAKPMSDIKQSLLNEGIAAQFILRILTWAFVGLNVWIYNMIFDGKYKVSKDDVEFDEADKAKMNLLTKKYAAKVLEYLEKLPDEILILGMLEYSMIERMNDSRIAIEPPKDKKNDTLHKE